jgi:hypothetical protein
MARTKEVKEDGTVHILPPRKKQGRAQAESKSTPSSSRPLKEDPPLRPLNEETPSLRPLQEEPPLRTPEDDTSRLSASSEEAVLDTSLSAQSKERASSSAQPSSSVVARDQRMSHE